MKKAISLALALTVLISAAPCNIKTAEAAGEIPAFPGAEGGGMYATGGRGGTIVHVTNLNDSGAGSLRDAVSHSGRIVVFDVGGTINLKSDISCAGNITVAGQTAPGGKGVTLKGGKFALGGDNTIVRFISSRPGEKGVESDYDAWGGSKGSNSIIDHCSIGWANDEQFGLYSANSQTVQYTIIGPSNCVSYHSKGAHGFGVMFGAANNSWHHNLLCHSLSRNFRGKVSGSNPMEFVNNVIYDWGYQTAYGTMGHLNYVGNYLKMGPSTKGGQRFINLSSGSHYELFRFYLTGNKITKPNGSPYSDAVNANNWNGGVSYNSHGAESDYRVDAYFPISASTGADVSMAKSPETADDAFEKVVSYAGASINPADNSQNGYNYSSDDTRTKIDAQVLYETRTGTGSLTGGRDFSTVTDSAVKSAIDTYGIQYCDYNSYYPGAVTEKTITDTDNDGMPDEWELARGLDPNNAADAKSDYLGDGYNNIEYYINDLTVNAFPKGVVTVSPTTVDLGEDYAHAKADADAITLSPTVIKTADDLTLPQTGSIHGSKIVWSSSSSAILMQNNRISEVIRPDSANEAVTLTASVTVGDFTIRRGFTVTVLALPKKFDFGNGAVQDGFTKVTGDTKYSAQSSFGFEGDASDMTRAPGGIPVGYENLYNDQVNCETKFRAEVPNGTYTVVIHYGSWNENFGTSYTVEGVSSGNLASTAAAQYETEVEITDGVLDVEIKKGDKKYGGYINGLEILSDAVAPDPIYHFDFGDGEVQDGYTAVTSSTAYSLMTRYGFTDGTHDAMTRAPGDIPSGMENLYNDQINGVSKFKADVPNGKYIVTIHYGSWNDGFGTNYTVEGIVSGNLASTAAAQYRTKVEVADGALDVEINKGAKQYGGYISGIDIEPLPTLPYHFDFGEGAAQKGYTAVKPSTIYSEETGYGFAETNLGGMTRAPEEFTPGFDELYNDQILNNEVNAPFTFKAGVPNGKYKVVIHYGSNNKDFSSDYSVEGALSGSLNSLTGTTYETETEVADGVLDVIINKGRKSWGGYISGMDVIPITAPPVTDPPGEDPRIETELSPDKTMLTASPVYCGGGTLICALYTGGRLIKCFAEEYSGDDMDFDVVSGADKAVVMLWNSFDKMTPVCETGQLAIR